MATVLFSMCLASAVHAQTQSIKADHTTVDVSGFSTSSLDAARALRMNLSHASVGGNIWNGLTTLATDTRYAFPNWSENDRGNPGWAAKISEFETWVAAHAGEFDVFQNKFCYIDQDADFAAYRDSMLAMAKKYSGKVFVWWTMPLTTSDADNSTRAAFNAQVRAYCKANSLPLYDIADIESHEVGGAAVTNGGVEALDAAQSSDGGHLAESGASRAAQAQWALMVQIAAKTPGGGATGVGGASATGGGSSGGESTGTPPQAGTSSDDSGCSVVKRRSSRLAWAALAMLGLALGFRRRVV